MKIYQKGDYALRRLLPAEWAVYKAARLEALKTDPQVFGSNFDREFALDDEEWRSRLKDPARAFWGLFYNGEIVGMTGAVPYQEDPRKAVLIATFIRPDHRGQKLSDLFYAARLDWARGLFSHMPKANSGPTGSKPISCFMN